MFEVEFTDEFERWWDELDTEEQESCRRVIGALQVRGPELGRPLADTLKGSRFPNMKELRVQHGGRPYRIFFVFDPRRVAILLLGGVKSSGRFYRENLQRAEQIYEQLLRELAMEGEDDAKALE